MFSSVWTICLLSRRVKHDCTDNA